MFYVQIMVIFVLLGIGAVECLSTTLVDHDPTMKYMNIIYIGRRVRVYRCSSVLIFYHTLTLWRYKSRGVSDELQWHQSVYFVNTDSAQKNMDAKCCQDENEEANVMRMSYTFRRAAGAMLTTQATTC